MVLVHSIVCIFLWGFDELEKVPGPPWWARPSTSRQWLTWLLLASEPFLVLTSLGNVLQLLTATLNWLVDAFAL